MDHSSPLLTWVFVASALVTITLIATMGAVLWFHQRRLAEQARAWGRHLLMAQEEERHQIARDLHDDVVQRLYSVQMRLDPTRDAAAVQTVSEVSRDLRSLARELYPPALASTSLGEALRDLVTTTFAATPLDVTVDVDEQLELPQAESVALFRVAQESLQNLLKHSGAMHATLSLVRAAPWVELRLQDDGKGFDSGEVAARSFGLRSMRERLELVGGTLMIESAPGSGTTVTARAPAS